MNVRLGIDLGGSFIKAGVLSSANRILHRVEVASGAKDGAQAVSDRLNQSLGLLLDFCHKKKYKPLSLGIGSPGTISQPMGLVTDASPNIADWRGTVLTKLFGRMEFPVFADNDANCAALAEYLVGLNCRYKDMVFITIGTGIGGGLIIDGRLHRGTDFAAAEIGHVIIKHGGKLCKCGRRGCLEAYASVPNLLRRARQLGKSHGLRMAGGLGAKELFGLYKRGNKVARKAILENAEYIGVGLGGLANMLNMQAIVIGGGFSGVGGRYIDLIRNSVEKHSFAAVHKNLKILRAKLGNDAGFMGAALLPKVKIDGKING